MSASETTPITFPSSRLHAVADLCDRPDGLVAQDPALAHRGHVALEDVQVGTADSDRVDPHDGVAIADDLGVRYVFPGLLTGTVVNDGSHDLPPEFIYFQCQPRRQT
jgi:hypothetical protein